MKAELFDVIMAALAVWRVAHMLSCESGPWDIFIRLRDMLGDSVLGKAMDCIACLSIWIAVIISIIYFVPGIRFLVIVLAISAMAIIVEAVHGMLRSRSTESQIKKSYKSSLPGTGTDI